MRLVIALGLGVALVVPFAASSARSDIPDPGAVGLYAVAHTSFVVVDASRDTSSTFGGRPIGVNVWYGDVPIAVEN